VRLGTVVGMQNYIHKRRRLQSHFAGIDLADEVLEWIAAISAVTILFLDQTEEGLFRGRIKVRV
jgi:hypothetical protein